MKDRYAGDIGDYGKFGMLRALAAKGLSIGVNWYLVDTPQQELSVNDGGKLIPSVLDSCDPVLAEALRSISRSPERSVRLLEDADLIPGACYYSDRLSVGNRATWHAGALSALAGADLVFLDPDNGLLVKSVGRRSAKSLKYAFYEEVADYVVRGQSVVVYNHRSRKKRDVYFGEICSRLASEVPQACDVTAITFPKGSVRDYFAISASPEHARLIREAFGAMVHGLWGDKGMCVLPDLPQGPTYHATVSGKRGEDDVTTTKATTPDVQMIGFWRENEPFGCCSKEHGATVEGVTESMQLNMGCGLPVAGWYELVRELQIQQVLGRL